jgi:RNA polymerase sigma-70 factor (ECF subfamily)
MGDRLDQLYHDHAPVLFRFLIRFTGNEAETKDLLQEIFIRLAKSPALLDQVTSPRSYLFRLAHRLAIDRHRREETRQRHETCAQSEQEISLPPQPSASDIEWQQQILNDALAQLPPDQKAVILLKIWEEMTFAEIAKVLQIPANTAASRYRYALDKLHRDLRPLHKDLP